MGNPIARNHAITALVIGVIEMVIGLIITITSFVLAAKASMSVSLTPYWAGLPFLIPGILGAVIGCTRNFGVMIAFMVINIIAFIIESIGCILVALSVALYASFVSPGSCVRSFNDCICVNSAGQDITLRGVTDCEIISAISTILYVLVVFLVIAAAVTLAGSIVGCMAVCCGGRNDAPGVVIQQPMGMQQQGPPPAYYQQPIPQKQ